MKILPKPLKKIIKKTIHIALRPFSKNISVNKNLVKGYDIFECPGFHIFFGYYDLQQLNKAGTKMLVHKLRKNASIEKDKIEIGIYEIGTKKYTSLAESSAWNWQQGSRLRWHPADENAIIYNDCENGNFCAKIFDLATNKVKAVIPYPLYDIDRNFKYGISCNFEKLHKLRPGYGYYGHQKNEDLLLIDLKSNAVEKICSLEELQKEFNPCGYEHYINHVSFSPNGEKFMFLYIWIEKNAASCWSTRLMIYDIKNKNLSCLETLDILGHYCWVNDSKLLLSYYYADKNICYYQIRSLSGVDKFIAKDILKLDGHPSFIGDGSFISDTYPKRNCKQSLFYFNWDKNNMENIAEIAYNPFVSLGGEKRCDLHPRFHKGSGIITVDSVCKNNLRNVLLFKMEDI
jgi:hypothetical protein